MIYAVFDFDTEDWLLLGDFPTECGVVEFAAALSESPCFKFDTFGVYRIGFFDPDTGVMEPCPRVRVWQHIPGERGGRAVGGGTPHPEVERTAQLCPTPWYIRIPGFVELRRFFRKHTPFKSKK